MTIIKKIPIKALFILGIGFVVGVGVGVKYGHSITWLTAQKTLNTNAVNDALNKPTTSNNTTNTVNVDPKKQKGEVKIDFNAETDQEATTALVDCETYLQKFIDTTTVKQFKKKKKGKD